jgi:hypothetical protein
MPADEKENARPKTKRKKNMKRQILILATFALVSCSPYQKYFRYDYEIEKAKSIHSVIVTPIDMIRSRPKGTAMSEIRKLEEKIQDYLRSNGYEIEKNDALIKNWQNEADKVNGFFDPTTGRIDGSKISMCLLKAIGQTREKQSFDGVLFVQLIERPAKLMGDRVYWDGCSRKLLDENGDVITDVTWRGEIKALSLKVQLFDKNHNLVFQNIGAIEFPYELEESYAQKQFIWKKQLEFKDEEIEEGIKVAMHPLIRFEGYPEKPNYYEE